MKRCPMFMDQKTPSCGDGGYSQAVDVQTFHGGGFSCYGTQARELWLRGPICGLGSCGSHA